MSIYQHLKPYLWPEKKWLAGSILFLIFTTALGLVYPNLLRYLIDDVIKKSHYSQVPMLALLVICVVTIKGTTQFLSGFMGGRFGINVAYRLRNALYEKLQTLSFPYYDQARTGEMMSLLTADLEAFRQFVSFGFPQLLNVFLMVTFGCGVMLTISWKLTLVTMLTMPVLAYAGIRFESKVRPSFRNVRNSMSGMVTAVQENITGVRTVKSFAREPYEVEKFMIRSEKFRTTNIETAAIWANYFPMMELVANVSAVILLGAGGYMVIQEHLTTGELVAFFSMIWYIIGPIWGIGFHINNYTQSRASGEKIVDLLHHYIHVKDAPEAKPVTAEEIRGHVRFENVSFGYGENDAALTDIILDAPPGSVIGILGGTGSGKTTMMNLLMRAYNIKNGRITVDGKDIKAITLQSLRRQISTVFQETFLFSSSIRNNIAYGREDVPLDEIVKAAKLAKAHDFITELPHGYDTIVGERGMGLSGGQKQRIAIARALLMNPRILIMDDATSAVDMETEHEIQAGFKELMKGRTTFIIAHRISSLRHADEIIVLERGCIVQRGTHETLLRQPGPYADTYRIQYADSVEVTGQHHWKRA